MTRELGPNFVAQIKKETVYPFFTVSLKFDSGEINLWSGLYNLNIGGTTYLGAGDLLDISDIEETTELAAKGATLSLSGLDSTLVSLALSEPYQGRECSIGFGVFNGFGSIGYLQKEGVDQGFLLMEDNGRILLEGDLYHTEVFNGYMDMMDINESPETSMIQLKVENRMVDLERERPRRYNSATQKEKYPLDRGLDFAESVAEREVFLGERRE